MSKFHQRVIPKGVYGALSKVKEELEEAFDAEAQGQHLMLLIELSDIVGAVTGVAEAMGYNLGHLVKFAELRSKVAVAEEAEEQARLAQLRGTEPALAPLPAAPPFDGQFVDACGCAMMRQPIDYSEYASVLDRPIQYSDYIATDDQQA